MIRPIVVSEPESEHALTYRAIADKVWEKIEHSPSDEAASAPKIVIQ